ncbi:MAG TPA: alpha/beta hydrolase [Mycobacteriales bacterium]|jgi:alpha-beta hydrolase superfamily lysophospholipase|nr:alpha/beta hydrolase [Mycobacteriales bacterium]
MRGYRTHLTNVWTVEGFGSVPAYTMIDSLLYLPDGSAPDVPRPGVVLVPGWGRYPYDTLARELAPALAEAGVVVLSLGVRRRGGEGQAMSPMPDSDLRDIKVALDALAQQGVFSTVLVGEDVGATSVARYAATAGDSRVAGIALVDPIPDLNAWLTAQVGEEQMAEWTRLCSQVSYEMKSDLIRIDVDIPIEGRSPLWIWQAAAPFLAWWSPNAKLRLPHVLEEVRTRVLAVGTDPTVLAGLDNAEAEPVEDRAAIAPAVARWATGVLPRPARPSTFELVEVRTEGDVPLVGYLTTPTDNPRTDAAVLVIHGLTTGPFSPMVKEFLPHYTDHGFAALAIETRRSGVRCIADSFPDNDLADVDAFIDLLHERGYDRVVLVGASLGSQAVSRYIARRHHPAVIAAVHLAPTGDMPTSTAQNVGEQEYRRVTEDATRLVAEGRGMTDSVVYDLTERGPSRFHSYRRTFWRAASWLAWWGPDAATMHGDLMAEVDVPVLLVSGTADDYNDQERMDFLAARAIRAPLVDQVWVGADHGMRGGEGDATAGVVQWLEKHDLVERRDPPDAHPLAKISAPVPGRHLYPDPSTYSSPS